MDQLHLLKDIAEMTGFSVGSLRREVYRGKLWAVPVKKAEGEFGRPPLRTTLSAMGEYVKNRPDFPRMQKLVELFGDSNDRGK